MIETGIHFKIHIEYFYFYFENENTLWKVAQHKQLIPDMH